MGVTALHEGYPIQSISFLARLRLFVWKSRNYQHLHWAVISRLVSSDTLDRARAQNGAYLLGRAVLQTWSVEKVPRLFSLGRDRRKAP